LDSFGVASKSYTEQYLDSTGIFKKGCDPDHGDYRQAGRSERIIAGLQRARRNGSRLVRPQVAQQKPRAQHCADGRTRERRPMPSNLS